MNRISLFILITLNDNIQPYGSDGGTLGVVDGISYKTQLYFTELVE